MYFVYILYSKSCDKYYKGQTIHLDNRLKRHNAGYEKGTSLGLGKWFGMHQKILE
ncbi:GIY-YIG nuclease family protein [Ekhidna sp.]|uniref:GIY-YIG nuclease family protein n=1 Tax=Ekhidna sp. TaxID=2608089 RepID=UPI0032EC5401